jgi:hypothetical protein
LHTPVLRHSHYMVNTPTHDTAAGEPAQWIWICIVNTDHFLRWHEHRLVLMAETSQSEILKDPNRTFRMRHVIRTEGDCR